MHVGIFIPALRGGGAEFVARRWVAELDALGHRVTIYLYDHEPAAAEVPQNVLVRQFSSRWRAGRHVLLPLWLHRRLGKDRPDVLLSLMTHGNVVAILTCTFLRRRDIPLVVSERNMPSLQYSNAHGHARITVWLARRLYRRASGVLAISHPVAGDLVSSFHVAPSRLYVVQNPVIGSARESSMSSYGARPQALHVAYVGRLVGQKRPSVFLAVLRALEQKEIKVRATVFGDGPLRGDTESEAAALGLSVSFPGWQEPWWDAAPDVDCVVVTASFEGLANVLVEAAAAGIPSVASSRALGVADAIVPGITGEFAMTDDPCAYADAVTRACSRPRSPDAGIGGWLGHFSTERSTARLVEALDAARGQSVVSRSA